MAEGLRRLLAALLLGLLAAGAATAVTFEPLEFETEQDRALYRHLIAELRCLVCQNQNLAESDAELAQDLRAEVYRMINTGAGEDQIVSFMVDRYGDFVLYRPPLRPSTVLLWAGPFVLALAGVAALLFHLRRRARRPEGAGAPLSDAERAALSRLVEETEAPADRQQR